MLSVEEFLKNYHVYQDYARVDIDDSLSSAEKKVPLISLTYGKSGAPTLLITGGVHGLERIGAQLCLSLMNSFHERLMWDQVLQDMMTKIQVVFIPLVNPNGYLNTTRSNGDGIDLMRNAPITSLEKVPLLLGGQNFSSRLPWYRGSQVAIETKFVLDNVEHLLQQTSHLISLDIHSGFGFNDQIWFPFANSKKQFTQLNELHLFFKLFEKTHPYHIYKIEPQSKNYLTHGDIWDYCFLNFKKDTQVYLPLTLEMGSWIWVKKNPLQIFSKTGLFNPIKEHRLNRTLRRHRPFFDFLLHSLISNSVWSQFDIRLKEQIQLEAQSKYYD